MSPRFRLCHLHHPASQTQACPECRFIAKQLRRQAARRLLKAEAKAGG